MLWESSLWERSFLGGVSSPGGLLDFLTTISGIVNLFERWVENLVVVRFIRGLNNFLISLGESLLFGWYEALIKSKFKGGAAWWFTCVKEKAAILYVFGENSGFLPLGDEPDFNFELKVDDSFLNTSRGVGEFVELNPFINFGSFLGLSWSAILVMRNFLLF